jgi:hypothetical protein
VTFRDWSHGDYDLCALQDGSRGLEGRGRDEGANRPVFYFRSTSENRISLLNCGPLVALGQAGSQDMISVKPNAGDQYSNSHAGKSDAFHHHVIPQLGRALPTLMVMSLILRLRRTVNVRGLAISPMLSLTCPDRRRQRPPLIEAGAESRERCTFWY